jgi:hypothetical protein
MEFARIRKENRYQFKSKVGNSVSAAKIMALLKNANLSSIYFLHNLFIPLEGRYL